jgi:hypothetical protein
MQDFAKICYALKALAMIQVLHEVAKKNGLNDHIFEQALNGKSYANKAELY